EARISQFGARYSFGQGGGSVPRPGPFPPRRVGTPDDASRAVATGPAATGPWSAAPPRRPGPWSHARGADGAASLANRAEAATRSAPGNTEARRSAPDAAAPRRSPLRQRGLGGGEERGDPGVPVVLAAAEGGRRPAQQRRGRAHAEVAADLPGG